MKKTVLAIGIAALGISASDLNSSRESLVVHEWGTFTSVAGLDGTPVEWAPLSGPADLPCFVSRLPGPSVKAAPGMVRMETPVLYFYPQKRTTLSVHVDFPQGWITEWYPKATVKPLSGAIAHDGAIDWSNVEVSPGVNAQFPTSKGPSHYFAARNTDAAPLRVGEQSEKLLFYRGMGNFKAPLRPRFTPQGAMEIANAGPEGIPLAIVFENRQGRIGYRVLRNLVSTVTVDPPELNASAEQLHQELTERLVEFGLYRKEALAMVETWRDSWFEEGTRVFYIYPRASVDKLLPLTIAPAPSQVARVFVGRVEVMSPWIHQMIVSAIGSGATAPLTRFGRFLDSFVEQVQIAGNRRLFNDPNLQRTRRQISDQVNLGACVE